MLNKIIGIIVFLIGVPVFAGELYETEDYLISTIGMNPYDSGISPSDVLGNPSSSDDNSFSPSTNEPTFDKGPNNSGDNFGSYGDGNFNQFFDFRTNFSSWTNQNSHHRNITEIKDNLAQALLTNSGGLILFRNRGKRRYEKTTFNGIESVQAVSLFSRHIRKIRDKQVAVSKITRAVKIQGTRFDSCFDISVNGFCIGNTNVGTITSSEFTVVCSFIFCC